MQQKTDQVHVLKTLFKRCTHTKLSAKSKRLILQLPVVISSLIRPLQFYPIHINQWFSTWGTRSLEGWWNIFRVVVN